MTNNYHTLENVKIYNKRWDYHENRIARMFQFFVDIQ